MKILVTGYKGYVGSHLMPKLNKHEVRGWDLKEEGSIFDENVAYVVEWADVVIHLAAKTSVSASFSNKGDYLLTNTLGTARMAELCYLYGKKLIYISSAARNDPFSSPYAQSKFQAEYLLEPFLKLMKLVILRPENIYGGVPKEGTMMHNFEFGEKLIINGTGEQTRDFIHIDDFTDIIKASFANKWNGQVVEVGTGKGITVSEVAALFTTYFKKRVSHRRPVSEMMHSIADTELLDKLYGKKLKWKLKDYIKTIAKQHDKS